ncbi:MAG: hypothetical protein ABWY82_04155, partial [Tardiphaga sp.]
EIARSAVHYGFALNIMCRDNLDAGRALIVRHSDTRFIIDPAQHPAATRAAIWVLIAGCWGR